MGDNLDIIDNYYTNDNKIITVTNNIYGAEGITLTNFSFQIPQKETFLWIEGNEVIQTLDDSNVKLFRYVLCLPIS